MPESCADWNAVESSANLAMNPGNGGNPVNINDYMFGQGDYDSAISVDPANVNSVFLGGVDILNVILGGAATDLGFVPNGPHADIQATVW